MEWNRSNAPIPRTNIVTNIGSSRAPRRIPTEPAKMMIRICASKCASASGGTDAAVTPRVVVSASAPSAGVMKSDASRLAVTSRLNSEIAVAMRFVVTPA